MVDPRNRPLRWLYYYAKLDISTSNGMIQRIHTVPEISDPLPSRHWCSGKVVDVLDQYKFPNPLFVTAQKIWSIQILWEDVGSPKRKSAAV